MSKEGEKSPSSEEEIEIVEEVGPELLSQEAVNALQQDLKKDLEKNFTLLRKRLIHFFSEHGVDITEEELLNEDAKVVKKSQSGNYFERKNDIHALIIETQGGAGHIQAAKRKESDLIKSFTENGAANAENMVERISVLQAPESEKESWMKLAFIDIGKRVIKDWNEKQKRGEMGSLTSLALFRYQVKLGERIFGNKAGKKAFTTFTARANMKKVYDTQNIFTPYIARAVNRYVEIKKNEDKCRRYNQIVSFNNFLRQPPIFRIFASDTYLYEIEHDANFTLSYTKVMTDLPTKGEDFFVSLRLMKKNDLENFHLEAPHAAPLTDKTYDIINRVKFKNTLEKLKEKHGKNFDTLFNIIVRADEIISYQELCHYLNANDDMRRAYDIAYYVMQCPNLIDLDPEHFHFTIGPIRHAFIQKYEERVNPSKENDKQSAEKIINFQRNTIVDPEQKDLNEKQSLAPFEERDNLFQEATGRGAQDNTIKIKEDDKITAIMLGSQASEKTLTYIDKYIEDALKDSEKIHYLFVFAGNYYHPSQENDDPQKTSLYQRVCEKIINNKNEIPSNLHIIPLENQGEDMIAQTVDFPVK